MAKKKLIINRKAVSKPRQDLLKGFKKLGEGLFATVYGKGNTVVKVIHDSDEPYIRFLQKIGIESENPYFPKIHKVVKFVDGRGQHYTAVFMEKLLEYNAANGLTQRLSLKALGAVSPEDLQYAEWDAAINPAGYARRIAATKDKHAKECLKVLRDIRANDTHEGNIMFRQVGKKMQLVITDPVAFN